MPSLFEQLMRVRGIRVGAAAYGLLALAATQIPLLNYLGFEFSLLLACVGSVIAGVTTIVEVRRCYSREVTASGAEAAAGAAFGRALAANLLALLLPVAVLTANAFFVKNCSFLEGLGFTLLLPVVSVVFASACAFFCAVHYRHPRLTFFAFLAATLAYSLALGYCTPAIFSYNVFYGYFPGLTYDEILGIHAPLLLFRLLTLVAAGALVWMAFVLLRHTGPDDTTARKGKVLFQLLVRPPYLYGFLPFILVFGAAFLFRHELGFESSAGHIQRLLGSVHRTAHCTIYYSADAFTPDDIRRVGIEHEFRLHQVRQVLDMEESVAVVSYIYPTAAAKQRLIGAGNTDIAKPWTGEIHLSKESADATMKHEIAHVVAGRFGAPVIRASWSTGLTEGLAMAVEWDWGNRTLHQYAAAMLAFRKAPDIGRLMSFTGFASQASAVSYVLAGSFCRYLMDTYGVDRLRQLYRSVDYDAVYGQPLDTLIGRWRNFLSRSVPVAGADRGAVEVLFRQPPIFRKVCARVVAARNLEAWRLLGRREYGPAEELFALSYGEAGGYDALSGLLWSALRGGKYEKVTALFEAEILGSPHPARFLPLFVAAGDAYWAEGRGGRALACFDSVYQIDFSAAHTEAAALRRAALRDSAAGPRLFRFFLSDAADSTRLAMLDSGEVRVSSPLVQFMRGSLLMRLRRDEEALGSFEAAALAGTDPVLEASRLRAIGVVLFRLGRYDEAARSFRASLDVRSTPWSEEEVKDWEERCRWYGGAGVKRQSH